MAVPIFLKAFLARIRRWLIVAAVVLLVPVALFFSVGRMVVRLDPVERADAIYVLAGTRVTRLIEAARLYREGYAPRILLSPGDLEYAEKLLVRQGFPIANDGDRSRDYLIETFRVPPEAVMVIAELVDNTAQEADAIRNLAEAGRWQRLIVIADRVNSRRVSHAFRRTFGAHLKIIVTANRDDPYDARRWWENRFSFRATFYEAPKLFAYWMGLGG